MPLKKDAKGRRWVEMELLVPGTPEQVWHAIATGPGNTAWFLRSEIEPRVGGTFRIDFGQGVSTHGEVTAWEPPHRFGYTEREWEPGAPPLATEITIESRSGDRCVLRMVHSLFASSDDWDDQMEGFEKGWPGYFAVLRVYLQHFAGEGAASFTAMAPSQTKALESWQRLGEVLGLTAASVGERRTHASGPERWSGVVEHVYQDAEQRYVLLRIDDPSPGIALVGVNDATDANLGSVEQEIGKEAGANMSVCRYFYGDDAAQRAAESEPRWRAWLTETFGDGPKR